MAWYIVEIFLWLLLPNDVGAGSYCGWQSLYLFRALPSNALNKHKLLARAARGVRPFLASAYARLKHYFRGTSPLYEA